MNEMSVKPNSVIDPKAAKSSAGGTGNATAAAVAGLASSFKDMVARVGLNLDSGLSQISSKSGISAVEENVQPKDRADEHRADPRDDGRDRVADRSADDRGDRDRVEPQRAERADDQPRDNDAAHRDSRYDVRFPRRRPR
ncbi:MAG: hypothetical protein VW405_11055 [Rhodospirillaceae bacterium]